jgi:hypothetical protein
VARMVFVKEAAGMLNRRIMWVVVVGGQVCHVGPQDDLVDCVEI